jgi:hypothetical protein
MSSTFTVPGLDVTPTSATFAGSVAATGTITGPAALTLATIADPGNGGAIPATASGRVPLVSTGAQTRTLAAPAAAGLELQLEMDADGGDIVLAVATTVNQTGNNRATFADAGDILVLRSIKVGANFRWRAVANDGVALSTV